jgi:hypothetical protein
MRLLPKAQPTKRFWMPPPLKARPIKPFSTLLPPKATQLRP